MALSKQQHKVVTVPYGITYNEEMRVMGSYLDIKIKGWEGLRYKMDKLSNIIICMFNVPGHLSRSNRCEYENAPSNRVKLLTGEELLC